MATQPQPQSQPQVTFPPTSLTICHSDLANALESLRTTPAAELSAVRSLGIVLNETNLLHWHGSLWPGVDAVFDDDDLDEYARLCPAPASSSINSPSKVFRALLRLVAESLDLRKLHLELDARSAAWSLFEDKAAGAYGGNEVDQEWKFVYDFYMDVGRALAEVFGDSGLLEVSVKTSIWDGMGAWLVGQISGRGTVVAGILPEYHDTRRRLSSRERVDEDGVKAD